MKGDFPPLSEYAALDRPTLLVRGTNTTVAAAAVVDCLHRILPNHRLCEIEGARHMSPLTHADAVNALIEEHLELHA